MPVRGKETKSSTNTKNLVVKKKEFSLEDYKKETKLDVDIKYKDQEWYPLSPAFQEVTGVIGIPKGHLTILRGKSDSGKTLALIEAAVAAQKMGDIPVFIITELKWSWEHARLMGLEYEEVYDEFGNIINYKGNFIYVDRAKLDSIEDVSEFILNILEDQEKGKLPTNLLFLWDSIGSIACRMAIEKKSHNNEWDAGAISVNFGKTVLPKILLSRKEGQPYTNTFVAITQVWTQKPDSPMGMPKLACKGGDTFPFHASLIITFGNVTNSGVTKLKATKNNKDITYASRTKIEIFKNHVNGISTSGKIVATPHGYILDSKNDEIAKTYFKEHADYFVGTLGAGDGEIVFISDSSEEEEDFSKKSKKSSYVTTDDGTMVDPDTAEVIE